MQQGLPTDHAATREWLLRKMQTMLKQDFVEYNAIPAYQSEIAVCATLRGYVRDAEIFKEHAGAGLL